MRTIFSRVSLLLLIIALPLSRGYAQAWEEGEPYTGTFAGYNTFFVFHKAQEPSISVGLSSVLWPDELIPGAATERDTSPREAKGRGNFDPTLAFHGALLCGTRQQNGRVIFFLQTEGEDCSSNATAYVGELTETEENGEKVLIGALALSGGRTGKIRIYREREDAENETETTPASAGGSDESEARKSCPDRYSMDQCEGAYVCQQSANCPALDIVATIERTRRAEIRQYLKGLGDRAIGSPCTDAQVRRVFYNTRPAGLYYCIWSVPAAEGDVVMLLRNQPFVLQAWREEWRPRFEKLSVSLPNGKRALPPEMLSTRLRKVVDEFLAPAGATNRANVVIRRLSERSPGLFEAEITGPGSALSGAKGRWEWVVFDLALIDRRDGDPPQVLVTAPVTRVADTDGQGGVPPPNRYRDVREDSELTYWYRRLVSRLADEFMTRVNRW